MGGQYGIPVLGLCHLILEKCPIRTVDYLNQQSGEWVTLHYKNMENGFHFHICRHTASLLLYVYIRLVFSLNCIYLTDMVNAPQMSPYPLVFSLLFQYKNSYETHKQHHFWSHRLAAHIPQNTTHILSPWRLSRPLLLFLAPHPPTPSSTTSMDQLDWGTLTCTRPTT